MSEQIKAVVEILRELVQAHYEKTMTPLLLSELGVPLRKQNVWPIADSTSLLEIIETAADPDLQIVRSQKSRAYIAVTTSNAKPVIQQIVDRRDQTDTAVPDIQQLMRPVLLAFCVKQEAGAPVFLRKIPPYRYELSEPVDEERKEFFRIEERYRRPGLKVDDLAKISSSDLIDLQGKIAAWCRDNGQNVEQFYRPSKKTSALERLLAAQPPSITSKIMIPADIALILSKHE